MLDVPVMILFFNRPFLLEQVFNAVRAMQPKQLFLVQDGPRDSCPEDKEKVLRCRDIVSKIDWPCDVYRNYSEENLSCDHREYTGISWCFQYVEELIILEDDCVPTESFFRLCEELLRKYKDNQHIHSISGFNRMNKYECEYDYIFSKSSAGCGWATWKRAWSKVEELVELEFIKDDALVKYQINCMDKNLKQMYGKHAKKGRNNREIYIKTGRVPSWEYLHGMSVILNDMLVITPTKNLIKYIGISEDATHCVAEPKLLPHKIRNVLTQSAYDIQFPIKHPPFVLRDTHFEKLSSNSMHSLPCFAKIEALFLMIRYGQWGLLKQKVTKYGKRLHHK